MILTFQSITLFGTGGSAGTGTEDGGGGGAGAFQVFGNILMPMMLMSKMMGFDFKGIMKESLGDLALEEDTRKKKKE